MLWRVFWGYVWGRSWVFILARGRATLELAVTAMMAIEITAVESMAIETNSVKQAPLTPSRYGGPGQQGTTIASGD